VSDRQSFLQDAVYTALDEINLQRPRGERLAKGPETKLATQGGVDSLELITLFVTIEQRVAEKYGVNLSLAELMTDRPESLTTVAKLVVEVERVLDSKGGSA
jgi:acyl carrier protein